GANVGDQHAVFEATHGTAPKYADKDVINPGSVILSGVMMLDHLGWNEAARLIETAMEATIQQKFVTYDFERLMPGSTKVKTSEFANHRMDNMVDRRKKAAANRKSLREGIVLHAKESDYCRRRQRGRNRRSLDRREGTGERGSHRCAGRHSSGQRPGFA